jgi:hypothetical protein
MLQDLNSLIIVVAWEIWKHRNAIAFEGARPNIQTLLLTVANESSLWIGWSLSLPRAPL